MKTKFANGYTTGIRMFACLVAGFAILSPVVKAADTPDYEPASKLLAEAKTEAYAISVDASILESYTRQSTLSWQSHAAEITRMKSDMQRSREDCDSPECREEQICAMAGYGGGSNHSVSSGTRFGY